MDKVLVELGCLQTLGQLAFLMKEWVSIQANSVTQEDFHFHDNAGYELGAGKVFVVS